MNSKKTWVGILALVGGLCWRTGVARELKDVSVEVLTAKHGAEAKQDAFDQAVERASKEMAEEFMGVDKAARAWDQIRSKVIKSSTQYVVFIKGSAPEDVGGQSRVQVQMRLSPDNFERALREAGALGGQSARLLPLVQIWEPHGSRYVWWADSGDGRSASVAQGYFKKFVQQLLTQFKGKGVHVLDPSNAGFRMGLPSAYRMESLRREDQVLMGQYLNADVILSGRIQVLKSRGDGAESRIEYELELWQTKTGRSLAEVSQAQTVGADNAKAVQAAMDQVQPKILASLAARVVEVATSGNLNLSVVKIAVEGNLNPRQMNELKKLLGAVREIRSLRERLIEPSRTTFESEASVNGGELARAIQRSQFPHFAVEVASSQDDRLVLAVKSTASAQ